MVRRVSNQSANDALRRECRCGCLMAGQQGRKKPPCIVLLLQLDVEVIDHGLLPGMQPPEPNGVPGGDGSGARSQKGALLA